MALGQTRDSFLNLAQLINEDDDSESDLGHLLKENGGLKVGDRLDVDIGLGYDMDDDSDGDVGGNLLDNEQDDTSDEKNQRNIITSSPKKIERHESFQSPTKTTDDNFPNDKFDPYKSLQDVKSKGRAVEADNDAAKTAVAEEANSDNRQYEGFNSDYYSEYNYDPYAPNANNIFVVGGQQDNNQNNLFRCLFPWAFQAPESKSAEEKNLLEASNEPIDDGTDSTDGISSDVDGPQTPQKNGGATEALPTPTADSNAANAGTNKPPDSGTKTDAEPSKEKDENLGKSSPATPSSEPDDGDNIIANEKPKKLRGILKRGPIMNIETPTRKEAKEKNGRRHMFPVYESAPEVDHSSPEKKGHDRHIHFSPMARVLSIRSCKNMTTEDKHDVWWQRSDYDDFKRTGRIIAKAMLDKSGSEVWLMTNKSWNVKSIKDLDTSSNGKKNGVKNGSSDDDTDEEIDQKWWHKFGHSRRGLEHIATFEEGKQRQQNVKVAIRAVLDEQRRQKIYRKADKEKVRSIYIQYAYWARELARASGASDECAVSSNFNNSKRKTREFYLLKHRMHGNNNNSNSNISANSKHLPEFMKPSVDVGSENKLLATQVLDQFTHTGRRSRRTSSKTTTKKQQSSGSTSKNEEAIHDQRPSSENMAKSAVGYGASGEDMANVLSGIGIKAN